MTFRGILTSVRIPRNVTSIPHEAFRGCDALTKAVIETPDAVFGVSAFGYCPNLTMYGLTGSTAETYAAKNSIPFVAVAAFMERPDFVLPAALTSVESEAFAGIAARVVYIPDGCLSIGANAFSACANLVQVRIPGSVTNNAFSGCPQGIVVFGVEGSAAQAFAENAEGFVFVEE